jgi:diguanylate cyclase (GGDEF)-like protein
VFDIKTGMVLWAAEAFTLALLLMAAWLRNRATHAYLSWSLGFGLTACGIGMVGLRGLIPDFLSIEIANTVALAGLGLWICGALQFDRRKLEGWAAIPMLIWIAGIILPVIRDSFNYRVGLYGFASAIGYAMIAHVLWPARVTRDPTRKRLALVFLFQCWVSAVVAAIMAVSPADSVKTLPITALPALSGGLCFVIVIMLGTQMFMERSERKLRALAVTDPLTGVLNRRGLIDRFAGMKAAADAERPLLALLLFDLDHFKNINDEHGHQAGDDVLVSFSNAASLASSAHGVFGRMGGEEFAAILSLASVAQATALAERIRTELAAAPVLTAGHVVTATVSIGIAALPAPEADFDRLMSSADRALYGAKEAGRNRTAVTNGDETVIIAAADRPDDPDPVDARADRQVNALRRISSLSRRRSGT